MFERFTDRARKILDLAKLEAISTKSEAVFTEHILIGMMRESSGVAGMCLSNFDLSVKRLRDEATKLNKPREEVSDKIEYSPHTLDLFKNALEAAKKFEHSYVGTEHLLMGLLSNDTFNAYVILGKCGINPKEVQHYLLKLLGLAEKKYKLKDAKDIPNELYIVNSNDKVVAFYHIKTESLTFVNFINIPLDDMKEIIEVCKEWKELNL